MKTLLKDYTFDPIAKTITVPIAIDLEELLLITNVSSNQIIYNFADITRGASIIDNVITLDFDTSAMLAGDALQIFIDVENADFNQLNQDIRDGLIEIVRGVQAMKKAQGIPDNVGRLRVNMETGATLSTVTTVGMVGTVSNQTSMGGIQLPNMAMTLTNAGAQNLRRQIGVS